MHGLVALRLELALVRRGSSSYQPCLGSFSNLASGRRYLSAEPIAALGRMLPHGTCVRSGLDVDKLDYFQRDARNSVGERYVDLDRFIELARSVPPLIAALPIEKQPTERHRVSVSHEARSDSGVRVLCCAAQDVICDRPLCRDYIFSLTA